MHEQEILTAQEARSEEIMLQIRLVTGLQRASLSENEQRSLSGFLSDGFLDDEAWARGAVVLSKTGRLIADRIVREILL